MKKKRIILIGYKVGSKSLKNLQTNLRELQTDRKVWRVRKNSPTFRRRASDKIVSWGVTDPCPHVDQQQEIAKKLACNKLHTFEKFKEADVPHPEWTTSKAQAQAWLGEAKTVVARTLLRSHSGKGIYIFNGDNLGPPVDAPLYVLYKKKKHEFRVHVFQGSVIDVTQKKRRTGFEGRNNQIRNHQNGWVYCRENVEAPNGIETLALDACAALGLHSGAVDIIWNQHENKCYVLEINTAPGIEGTTCNKYSSKIIEGL